MVNDAAPDRPTSRLDPASEAEAEAEAHRQIAQVDALATRHDALHQGRKVRWRRFGQDTSGPPLVLLHGGHGSWMHWLRNAPALSESRSVWVPDMPGFNDSDTPPEPIAGQEPLAPTLELLAATLDQLVGPGTEIDLAGFSFGGFVASRLALQRGRVRRLALVGSAGHASMRRLSIEMINWRAAATREEERSALRHNLKALMLHDEASIDALAFVIHDVSCHGTRLRSKEVSLAGGLQATLDALSAEILLLWGEFDVTADPRPLLTQLLDGKPDRRGAIVEGAGHWAQLERAAAVNSLLIDFLR
ncbi:Pimeloyl-ACP methyl ester carboxylesterase [Burkholderiales bacterium 8X]|nr:Pimeloyl-ACP methyl ester carboxylesterase [Burkholderiales bacterium 8X]